MKMNPIKFIIAIILVLMVSCDEPETVVTDIVRTDGSVLRKIEMKNTSNEFKIHKIQVPFDSTWIVRDSLEFDKKGDTTFVKRAEKLFKSTEELNNAYKADSGSNKNVMRRTTFNRKFRWFNTVYRFSEIVEKQFKYGYPVSDFLDKDELEFFYSPEDVTDKMKEGPDSLKYKELADTINSKTDKWLFKSAAAEWIGEFTTLTGNKAEGSMSYKALKAKEDELVRISIENSNHFDSLWKNGVILTELIGEEAMKKYKIEADSAIDIVSNRLFTDFHNYTIRIIMPGKLLATNGFLDTTKNLLWPVKSDYFMTQQYEMWAESKTSNTWAWVVSGIFLLFVFAGIIFRSIKKG